MKDKKSLRKELIVARKNFSDKLLSDSLIEKHIYDSCIFQKANKIFIYVSTEIEISTIEIINYSLKNNKKVYVPLSDSETCTMEFYSINSLSELHKGYYNIFEPEMIPENKAVPDEESLMIVPGLAFSKKGFRVGYGKGFYDKYLSQHKCKTMGLCYDRFIMNDIEFENTDESVDCIATESGIKYIK